ncbi:Protein-tyrosine-phosphatase [Caldicellulosiruptor kronotskyensis 2002]|uniref:protein-tyrosine-phosphatase n=1 Tax=Caldicellulosiruptor kronotskyensis (strain DSM 18902 / VKM B-2412 / 2002) TaxID=632348 RepID=E4SDX5_CALK2|nr:CpsB/CapC family capsule biosynthesis tyrosine phosphatase [Caldicellulosiruptor kronotskyensis]ADQ45262.1 Protein-tyrosine-phosphatase [Caldicellulosiruptor kronotskyensis 2002]
MIDIHCHLMVGVDDGAEDLDEAKKMIKLAKKEGINEIIVTPHYTSRLKVIYDNKFEEIQKIALQEGVMLHRGCEYKLQDALVQKSDLITLGGSDYVLIEITQGFLAEYVLNQVYELKLCGYEVIIAHPERSFEKKDIDKLKKLAEMNVYFQLTAASFIGAFGRQIKKFSEELLERGLCHFIASDAHNKSSRQFYFQEAKKYLKDTYNEHWQIDLLFEQNQKAILNGSGEFTAQRLTRKNFLKRLLGSIGRYG